MNMRAMNIALPDLARQKAPLNVKDSAMTGRMYRQIATLSAICGMAFLSACSVAPEYAVPQMTLPAQYKYALSEREIVGAWQDAQPADASVRGEWWSLFDDPALNLLQDAARQANPSLQSAWARLNKARALQQEAKSARSPRIGTGFGLSRERPSPVAEDVAHDAATPFRTKWRVEAGISYEADLFGRLASATDAARADMQRDEALYASVLLTLQADIAQHYFLLQELDAERAIFAKVVTLRDESCRLVLDRHEAGLASEFDVSRARTELESVRSEALAVDHRRAIAENALAILTGKLPADFSVPVKEMENVVVSIPPGLPSSLLERRPDIAAAERAMAAANARIGMAKAAFFPKLDLTASGGFESAELGRILIGRAEPSCSDRWWEERCRCRFSMAAPDALSWTIVSRSMRKTWPSIGRRC